MQRPVWNEVPAVQVSPTRVPFSHSQSLLPHSSTSENSNLRLDVSVSNGSRSDHSLPTPPPSASLPYAQYPSNAFAGPARLPRQDATGNIEGAPAQAYINQGGHPEAATRHVQHHYTQAGPSNYAQPRAQTIPQGYTPGSVGTVHQSPHPNSWPDADASPASPRAIPNDSLIRRRSGPSAPSSSSTQTQDGQNNSANNQPNPTGPPMNAATSHAHALLHPLRGYLMQKVDQAITATGMRLAQEFGTINEHTAQRERQLIALSSRQQDNGASAAEANALRQERHSLREECMRLTEDLKNAQEAQVRMKDNLMKLYNACFALREEGSKLREERVALREENWALRKEIARLVDAGNENVQSSGSLGKVEGEAAQERSGLVASVQQELTRRHNAAKEVAFLEQVVKEIAPSEPTVNSASQDVKESSEDPVARLLAQSSPVVLSRLASLSCSRSEARINQGTPPVQASPVRKFEALQAVDNVLSISKSEPDPEPRLLPAQTANISRRSAVPPSSIREVIDLSNILDSPPRRYIGIEDALPSPTNDSKMSAPHLTPTADSEVNVAMDVDLDRKREREGSPEQPEHPAKRRRTSDEVTDSASGTVETPQLTEEKLVAATEPLHRSRSSEDWLAYALKEESERVTTPDEMKSLQERLVSVQPSEDMSISESGSVATISTPGLETSAPVVESVKLVKTSALAAAETVAETTESEVMESVSLNEPRMSRVGLGDNTKDQHEASEGNLSASASAGTKSWVVDDQNAPRAQYHRTKLLSAAKRPEETPLIEAYKQAEVQSRAPQTPQVQLEGPRPPTRPQHRKHLSLRHVPLMYRSTKTGMICRMCLSRKEVRDRKLPVTTFPLAASWVELASHCETVHPRAYETLIGMAPEEIEEAKLKLGSK